jgi:hypothetical protein
MNGKEYQELLEKYPTLTSEGFGMSKKARQELQESFMAFTECLNWIESPSAIRTRLVELYAETRGGELVEGKGEVSVHIPGSHDLSSAPQGTHSETHPGRSRGVC